MGFSDSTGPPPSLGGTPSSRAAGRMRVPLPAGALPPAASLELQRQADTHGGLVKRFFKRPKGLSFF